MKYEGILPNLFAEDKGVVVEGVYMNDGRFIANKVLAKHDENYMPPEVIETLKKSGKWQGNEFIYFLYFKFFTTSLSNCITNAV